VADTAVVIKPLKLRPSTRTVQVTGSDTLLASANPRRKALIISNNDPGSFVYVKPNSPAAIGDGVRLWATQAPLLIDSEDWGLLAAAEWHAIASLAGGPAGPSFDISAQIAAASTAAVAVLLTLTPDVGAVATLLSATAANFTGAVAAVQLELVVGANVFVLAKTTTELRVQLTLKIPATGVVRWRCTGVAPATTVDLTLSGTEQVPATTALASAAVGVTELEG
jgi:hypothetical protein